MINDLTEQEKEKWFKENYHIFAPFAEKAFARLFFNPGLLWAESCSDEFLNSIFAPPATILEARTQHAADIIVYMIFEKKINSKMTDDLISKAMPEIEEAYNVILRDGGGWSGLKGDPDKRQAVVLAWFDKHRTRLSFLKRSYLEDPTLYNDGGGQEKRNLIVRLSLLILQRKVAKRITFQNIYAHYKKLSKAQQIKWLSQILELS
jgi:hypothetical protein